MESLTIVAGNPGLALARFDARSRSNDENNENMDLVLRSVNAHDELVEALRAAEFSLMQLDKRLESRMDLWTRDERNAALIRTRAALAKAGAQ